MDASFALDFAVDWVAAWNSRDVDRVLSFCAVDVVFSSPLVVKRLGHPSGEVQGLEELRSYWSQGLKASPDYHFTLEDVRMSVDTVIVNYRNQNDQAVTEVLRFQDGLVRWACAAHPVEMTH